MANCKIKIDVETPFDPEINGESLGKPSDMAIWEHWFVLIGHKNMLDSLTELSNECIHKLWGLSIIIIIKPFPDRASAMKT